MSKSIYDILNKKINYKNEYRKIKKMFLEEKFINLNYHGNYTYVEVFNHFITKWKYRGTKCSLYEIMKELETETNYGKNPINDCLYLCELILGIRKFLCFMQTNNCSYCGLYIAEIEDSMLVGNISYILQELGYNTHIEEEYKVILIKNNTDAINTATIIDNKNIESLIINYNDFKISNNINDKQKILFELAKFLEPKRTALRKINSKLESDLFMVFNKLNIRHNNKDGNKKEKYISDLNDIELLKWYDETYNLVLIAIRLLELDNLLEPFERLRKEVFNS